MLNQVSTSGKCLIPSGEVLFKLKNEKTLVVRINVTVEQFNCKFKKVFSCSEIPEFKATLVKKPEVLFKKILANHLFSENLTSFFNSQEGLIKKIKPISSKLSKTKKKESRSEGIDNPKVIVSKLDEAISSGDSFESPKKRSIKEEASKSDPMATRLRSKSHSNRHEDNMRKSLPEFSSSTNFKSSSLVESLQGKTLGITKRISPREKTQDLSPKSYRTSPREFTENQFSGFYKQLSPLDVPKTEFLDPEKHASLLNILQSPSLDTKKKSRRSSVDKSTGDASKFSSEDSRKKTQRKSVEKLTKDTSQFSSEDSSKKSRRSSVGNPPRDASQVSSLDSPKSLDSQKNPRRTSMELNDAVVKESKRFKIPGPGIDGEGQFIFKKDKTFDMKVQFVFQECQCEFERTFSPFTSPEKVILDFDSSIIQDPYKLFEKIIGNKRLVSEKFSPFFCPQLKTIETIDETLTDIKENNHPDLPNSSLSREKVSKGIINKTDEYSSVNNSEINKGKKIIQDTLLKYSSKIFGLDMNENDEFIKIYFGNVGRIPPLPKDIDVLLNSQSKLWEGKTIGETHSLYLIFEEINGQPTGLESFAKAIEKPTKEKEKYRMEVLYHNFSTDLHKPVANTPYWALITDDVIKGTVNKTSVEQSEIMLKSEENYQFPRLVEMGIRNASDFVNNRKSNNPKIFTRCEETIDIKGKQINMVMKSGDKDGELVIKAGSDFGFNEGLFGVIRLPPG